MKVYVASSFSFIPKVEEVVQALEEAGHEITCKWWARDYYIEGEGPVNTQVLKERFRDMPSNKFYERPETRFSFYSDIEGIEDALVFVLVGPDEASRDDFRGANVELGYAMGMGLACFSVGALWNSALYYKVVKYQDVLELVATLEELEAEL